MKDATLWKNSKDLAQHLGPDWTAGGMPAVVPSAQHVSGLVLWQDPKGLFHANQRKKPGELDVPSGRGETPPEAVESLQRYLLETGDRWMALADAAGHTAAGLPREGTHVLRNGKMVPKAKEE